MREPDATTRTADAPQLLETLTLLWNYYRYRARVALLYRVPGVQLNEPGRGTVDDTGKVFVDFYYPFFSVARVVPGYDSFSLLLVKGSAPPLSAQKIIKFEQSLCRQPFHSPRASPRPAKGSINQILEECASLALF